MSQNFINKIVKISELFFLLYNCMLSDIQLLLKGILYMKKLIEWDLEKAKNLKEDRDIELERISVMIEEGKYLDIMAVPSRKEQRMFILDYDDYIVCVPFVESDQKIFIKTAYRNRKRNKLIKEY